MVFMLFMSPLNISFLNECNWCPFRSCSFELRKLLCLLLILRLNLPEALPTGKKQYTFVAAGTNGVNKCNGYINGRSNWFPSVWEGYKLPIKVLCVTCSMIFCFNVILTLNKLQLERGNGRIPSTTKYKKAGHFVTIFNSRYSKSQIW